MRIPTATYRIQFHAEFNFEHAQEIVAYLADLGISDFYASPIFQATQGSTHGYDVVNPTILNPELGTESDFAKLSTEIHQHQMGWLQDIVPNHMAYDSHNSWLMDVLENGKDSEFFDFFDINWNQPDEEMNERVLAPFLGDFYGNCLERGEIKLDYQKQNLIITYFGLELPVKIESYLTFVTYNLDVLEKKISRQHPDFIKFLGIIYLLKNLSKDTKDKERLEQKVFVKNLLEETYQQNSTVEEFIQNSTYSMESRADWI
jgi:(1->4)-alpha-D-glucan 1-alpha-D-glucosylmutase